MLDKKRFKELNILYVEDDAITLKKICSILSRTFKNVFSASNGKEALDYYQTNAIDIIISDINMPIMNGLDMAKEIRLLNNEIPIILTTARTETNFMIEAIDLNVSSYILKPINMDTLIDKIYECGEKILIKNTRKLLDQYKSVVDESSIVVKFDYNGKITFINHQYSLLSGYCIDEVKNNYFNFNTQTDMNPNVFLNILETIKDKVKWSGKLICRSKDDLRYILDMTIVPILNFDNSIQEFISISNDITYAETLNNTLELQVENYEGDLNGKAYIFNQYKKSLNRNSVLIRINKEFKINDVNKKFLKIIKLKEKDLIGKDINFIIGHKENNPIKIVNKLVSQKTIQQVIRIKNANADKYIDFTFSPIKNNKNEVIEYLLLGNDISEIIDLHKEIEETQKDVIFTLGSIGESRSNETGNHVKRVALYSYILAKKVGLDEKEAQLLRLASPMHDIGKVGIPDNILNKPGKLTEDEFKIMKSHAEIGYEMLKNSKRKILKASAIVSYEHHEKWDGSGYPRSLKGEDIHIFGRITAIADVFDALGSDRCYKKAWPLDKILEFFKKESGKHFDPNIVNLLLDNLDDMLIIRDKYTDSWDS